MKSIAVMCLLLLLAGCGEPPPTAAVTYATEAGTPLLIRNVTLFHPQRLEREQGRDVLVADGRIVAIRATSDAAVSADTVELDGTGATLLPGLIDMHGHIESGTGPAWTLSMPDPQGNLQGYVYAGVTTVFDPGDSSDDAYTRRDEIARGELIGPQVFTAGRIITHPQGHPRSLVQHMAPWWIRWYLTPIVASGVDSAEQARAEVDLRADAGADAVKIVIDQIPLDAPYLDDEVSLAIVEHADRRGLRTVAHIGTTADAIAAGEAGVSLWVHGVYKEPIPEDKVAQLAGYGIPMVATTEVFDSYGRMSDGPIQATRLEREIVSPAVLDSFYPVPEGAADNALAPWLSLMAQTREVRRENVSRLHAAGVKILAGSDVQSGVFPGASLHRELQHLVDAGMAPAEAIRAATYYPAVYLEQSQQPEFGVIATGKRGDLLLVEGDPSADITALMDIRAVILQGRLVQRQALAAAGGD